MKILLGISGGLDSAYSVRLLLDAGHEVEGATLVMHEYTELSASRSAAEELRIPHHVVDCTESFECVKENLINEYTLGRTPNPCVICNSEVKFKYLYRYAKENGFDKIATGHYARMGDERDNYAIYMAKDKKKDQSYMLWRLPLEIRKSLILPLGDMEKSEVRVRAREDGLSVFSRPESQEICFLPNESYTDFIEKRRGESKSGYFINNEGKILGTHRGIIYYTVGQRKGLGIATGKRMFVTKIDPVENTVTLSELDETRDSLYVSGIIFSSEPEMKTGESREYLVKLRYLQAPVKATLTYLGEGRGRVDLSVPQRAVTPGQSAVFYVGERLALGAFID